MLLCGKNGKYKQDLFRLVAFDDHRLRTGTYGCKRSARYSGVPGFVSKSYMLKLYAIEEIVSVIFGVSSSGLRKQL